MTETPLTAQQWRRLGVSVYLPTAVSFAGFGAIVPLVPLSARDLGADVPTAALVAGLMGIGVLLGALPAGALATRFGEKKALVAALFGDVALLGIMLVSTSVPMLAVAVLGAGFTGAVLSLARQAYLTDVVPAAFRGRALSTLGGVFRIGGFVGPLVGAAVVAAWGLRAGYAFAILTSLIAAIITLSLPDVPTHPAAPPGGIPAMLRGHARTFLTLGLGAAALMFVRTARDSVLPLWCEAHGLSPSATSLVYAASMGLDMLLFYLGGAVMDRFGRRWVAVPALVAMGTCFVLLVLTGSEWTIAAVAALLGLGNGISSGVVMTIGSDASPAAGRAQFLAGWRLTTGLGQAAAPLVIGGVAALVSLAGASVAVGLIGFLGAIWLWRWLPGTPEPAGPAEPALDD